MIIKRASLRDKPGLAHLLGHRNLTHQHMDWRSPYEWLGSQPFWVIENGDQHLLGALSCIQEVPPAAWIRLFSAASGTDTSEIWQILLDRTLSDFSVYPDIEIVTLALNDWYKDLLKQSGFKVVQQIVILEWNNSSLQPFRPVPGVSLRLMKDHDLNEVLTLDHLAFKSIWKLSKKTMRLAYHQSSYATVAEFENKIVGYQISSSDLNNAHLSRLAVLPDMRRQKIAYMLVCNLLEHYLISGIAHITVNTQDDNFSSLALYSKLGFSNTGDKYPVFSLTPNLD